MLGPNWQANEEPREQLVGRQNGVLGNQFCLTSIFTDVGTEAWEKDSSYFVQVEN